MIKNDNIEVVKRKYYLTQKGIEYVSKKLSLGVSYKDLAKKLQIDAGTLSNLCKENHLAKDNRRKYTLNEHYFKIIDTKEKAYWLGFLAADGSISETRGCIDLTLQPQDRSHIEKFLKAVGSNKEVKAGKSNHRQYDNVFVHLNSTTMVKELVQNGVHQNKSLNLTFPTDKQVPPELKIYWILGYFDGDGCISSWQDKNNIRFKTSFTGTVQVLQGINNFFGYSNKLRQEHRCTNNTKNLTYTETKSKTWLNKTYDLDSIEFCLTRKYKKYQDILTARNEK